MLRSLAAWACVALLAAGCSTSRSAARHDAAESGPTGRRPLAAAATSRVRQALAVPQVMPAPYQLPWAISDESVLPVGHRLLVAGGFAPAAAATAVVALDPVTGWALPAGQLATRARDAGGTVLAGRALIFGGAAGASATAVQALTAGGRATLAGRLPAPRPDLAAVTVGRVAYLVGGSGGARTGAAVLATRDGRHFRVAARLPVAVRSAGVAADGQQIWVFGGRSLGGMTSIIQRIDVGTGRARVAGRLPRPLAGASAFTLGGRIFLAGGQTAASRPRPAGSSAGSPVTSGTVYSYNPGSGALAIAGQLPVPVTDAAAAVIGGTGYLLGGVDGHTAVPAVTTFRLVSPAHAIPPAAASAGGQAAAGWPASSPQLRDAPWLAPPGGRGHLAPGSDPSALPAGILIADHRNNRLVIIDPQGRIRWTFPRPGDLTGGQTFYVPDDAFFSPDGRYIVATQEDDQLITVIDVATRKIVYRYGTSGSPGQGPGQLDNPDDAMLTPAGDIIAADIKNCRIIMIRPPAHRPLRILGTPGNGCWHQPPDRFGSPNGAFPLADGRYLITEINGDWADEISLTGQVSWSVHPPGVAYPSDTNEVYPGRYLTADYSDPGQVAEFDAGGRLLWRFGGLNHPSLALPLPNGDILANDDYNDRVIVIDPATRRIVWQYGHTADPGTALGYLNDPDGVDLTPPDSMLISHAAVMGSP